jgi:peptidoglycan/xylan/chitin deacetylase (PgdA/CDA1 family)
LQPGALPGALDLRVNGRDYHWQLGETARYDEAACHRHRDWRAWQTDEPTSRHAVYRSLWQLMRPMADGERRQVRRALLAWAGACDTARPTHRALAPAEIIELARGGLVEVGCHTVTHPQLAALNADAQREEISRSKAQLEETLGRAVTSFAYPYGGERDYTGETVTLVQEAGFDCACSTSVGLVERHASPFQLPRLQVQDMDGDGFARLLSERQLFE